MGFIRNIAVDTRSDAELIDAYKQTADLNTLGALYQRYMDLVYGVCLKYLQDTDNAKDSTMLIFEELITKLQKHEVENFKSWLYQLSKNHCLMKLRSEKRATKVKIDPSPMQNEENVHLNGELDKEEHFERLNFCLGQLIKEQRLTIELFYLQQKSYNEIVDITGIEWSKVRSYIQNGRRNLKTCMDQQAAIHGKQ
ncbi:MAG: RNA polymerase subunit sigma-70 [Chitinophagaceae bacterium]